MSIVRAATIVLVVGAMACSGGESVTGSSSVTSPTVDVGIASFAFEPASVTVRAGDQLRFANKDAQPHTATSDAPGVFDTSAIAPTDTSSVVTISTPGTYPYHCSFHPFMKATLTVQ
jgi:plastocyanin